MIDFIYTVFIAPLEYWMKVVLLWGHGVCSGNWGWAIVLMSLVVNTVILPIYMKAESWQEEEQRIRLGFEAKESMIKRVFKGQERFAMISTMRRQAGYTAFLSMRSSLGFFLQIPFFFAAYHFLSHFDPLLGVSFMGLADLGRPDEAIKIGGFAINVMPILMTVINIGSALIYTKNLAKRDKIQLYAMAALFLVLLYDAASGLVLYWTCNNIYSLLKNIVYDLVRKAAPAFQAIRWPRFGSTQQKASTTSFEPLWRSFLVFGIWVIAAIFGSLSSGQATFLSESQRVLAGHIANPLFLLAAVASVIELIASKAWKKHVIFALLLLTGAFFTAKFWYRGEFVSMARHGATLVLALTSLIPAFGISAIRANLLARIAKNRDLHGLYEVSSAWLAVLLTLYLPIHAFNTAPETFNGPDAILARLLLFFGLAFGLFWVLGKLFDFFKAKRAAALIFGFLALYFTVYAFLLPLNVGTIDGFRISEPRRLFRGVNLLLDTGLFIALAALFVWAIRRAHDKALKTIFALCITFSSVAALTELWSTRAQWDMENDATFKTGSIPAWNDRFLGFSKTGTNTVLLILDMFSGFHVQTILDNNPDIRETWKDATWYADCLATGPTTQASLASIVCGKACTPQVLNKKDDETLIVKINRAYAAVSDRFGPNVDVSLNERTWLEPQLIGEYAQNNPLALRYMPLFYLSYYSAKRGIKHKATSGDGFLVSVSLFSATPWSLKNFIYEGGSWIGSTRGHNDSLSTSRLRDWAFLESFPELANANAKKSTLKLMYSEITHQPWYMEPGGCEICQKGYPLKAGQAINPGHLQTETCALRSIGKWLTWMKANGVYDNTTIILTSDHGHGIGRKSALLLVKPAGAHQKEIQINRSPVELSDASEMIFGAYPKANPNRVRTFTTVGARMGTTFRDVKEVKVKGPLMENSSWANGKAYRE